MSYDCINTTIPSKNVHPCYLLQTFAFISTEYNIYKYCKRLSDWYNS